MDQKKGINKLATDEALSCEPYYLLQPYSVCQLFNRSMASQPVPDPLLQEVLRYCQQPQQKPQDHKELRECVNKYSIYICWLKSSGELCVVIGCTAVIIVSLVCTGDG